MSHITATARKGSLTVKAVASGDGLLAIQNRYAFQNCYNLDKANTVLNGNKRKIQSLCKEQDLVICDHECLYVAFLEHLINFMRSFFQQVFLTH